MKVLQLDNYPSSITNKLNIKPEIIDDLLLKEIKQIAKEIHDNHSDSDLFIINANVLTSDRNHSDCAGIELLKFIRLYGLNQYVILYSFLNREQLMQLSIKHSIIFSKGVSFYRLPEIIINPPTLKELDDKAKQTADKNELFSIFRTEYNPDNRHFDANKYCVWQLAKVQKAFENLISPKNIQDFNILFDDSFAFLNSYEGMIVKFLHNQNDEKTEQELDKIIKEREKISIDIALNKINSELFIIEKKLKQIVHNEIRLTETINYSEKNWLKKIIEKFIPRDDIELQDALSAWSAQRTELEKKKTDIINYKNQTTKINQRRGKIQFKNYKIINILKEIEKEAEFTSNDFSLEVIKENLKNKKPKIIYVDDLANNGWSAILQRMIYGEESDSFVPITPGKDDSIEEITDLIISKIKEQKDTKLLILDIRLKDEKGYVKPSDLSGFQVLHKLNDYHISCPILIVSASNKIWSLQEAFKGNAMAFWIKEGMDSISDEKSCVENYLRLIDLIYSLTENYEIFKILSGINHTRKNNRKSTG